MRVVGKIIGAAIWAIGGLAALGVDVVSSIWVTNEHGLLWAVLSWIFMFPLTVIPFLAGYGWWFIASAAVALAGAGLYAWSDQ